MRLERPRHRLLMLVLIELVLALVLGAFTVKMTAVQPPWNAGVPRSVIVFGGPEAASRVKPRMIICMLNRFVNATKAPGRPNAETHPAL